MPDQDRTQESNAGSVIKEVDRLLWEQDEAISRALYVGMSVNEAKEYDKRRKRINELFETLCILKFRAAPPCKRRVKLGGSQEAR
jgi:hypothetical protein